MYLTHKNILRIKWVNTCRTHVNTGKNTCETDTDCVFNKCYSYKILTFLME